MEIETSDTTERSSKSLEHRFEVRKGEGYEFRAIDFGAEGTKIELFDPRDLDLLDRDRIHAVILSPRTVRELLQWMRIN